VAAVHRVAGLIRANAGSYEQAEAEYLRAIELEPANADTFRRLGQAYERSGRLDQALAAFKRAIELEPSDFRQYQALGSFYSRRGDLSERLRVSSKNAFNWRRTSPMRITRSERRT
jgi:tetratricopeptide (TPR) repeat protein